jgi:hypothetical protein
MGKLSGAAVQRGLASLRDVEEALARQVLYGSDLATSLLEQAPTMDENALALLLAETHALAPAPGGELPRAASDALRAVPGDVALRHGLYPLEQSEGRLVVVVSEPLRSDVEQDLSFALGLTIEQRIAPLVRIRQAISRDYGLPLDRRSQRVIAKLEGRPDPSPSVAPSPLDQAPDMASLPRPPSIPPLGLPSSMDGLAPLHGGRTRDAPAEPAPAPAPAAQASPATEPPPLPAPAIRGVVPIVIPKGLPGPQIHDEPPALDDVSIHERLTSPAPPVAPNTRDEETAPWPAIGVPRDLGVSARVTAPAPGPAQQSRASAATARSASARLAAPMAKLAAWSAESRQAERRGPGRHRGPYSAAAAEQDLMAAEGRDDVLAAFFAFAHQYFEYSVLFAVHGDLAEGRDAHGPGADHAKITGIGVPLDMSGSLATARREGRFTLAPLAKEGLDARLALDLERRASKRVLLLPLLVRNRCVLIFYGDDGAEDVELSGVGDVIAFAPLVAAALENVILRKKTAVRQVAGEPGAAPKQPASLRPSMRPRPGRASREERAEALALAMESTVRPVIDLDEAGPGRTMTPAPAPRAPAPAPQAPAPAQARSPAQAPSPPGHSLTPVAVPRPQAWPRSPTPSQGTPRTASAPPPDPGTPGPVFPLSRRAGAAHVEESPGGASQAPAREKAVSADEEAPEISISATEIDWLPDEDERVGAPDSQVVVAAQLPIRRHSSAELRLPTVIVNIDNDLEALVRRLEGGDVTALDRLVQQGAAAASLLVARFPGPMNPNADRLGAPELASQQGPILRALVGIGQAAVPFLAVRSNDADPTIRMWATQLLGELPSADAAQAVGRRVTDSQAEVRRAALEAGRLLQTDEDARTALRDKVSSLAEGDAGSIEGRVAAIEALAHFRDGRAVPRLIRIVATHNEVGQSAEWALGVITRQAFGRDVAAWEAWWKAHADGHRIEWLIDALMHDEAELRRAAGEELKTLTKEYFGYYDDLAKSERAKAQVRYREWWEATGKARFSNVSHAVVSANRTPTRPPQRGRNT